MVIDNLYLFGVAVAPDETDTPLLVDADTLLSFSIPFQGLEAVRRWNTKIIQRLGVVEHTQLAPGYLLNISWQLA